MTLRFAFVAGLVGLACNPRIQVGHEDPDAGDGGALIVGAPWSAGLETGDTSEWQGPLADSLRDGTGSLTVARQLAHTGTYALEATIAPMNDALDQAMIGRRAELRSGSFSAWYYVPQTPTTDYWVIMKLSGQVDGNRFDIDVQTVTGDVPRLRLYEHGKDYITPAASLPLPIATWFQLEVDLVATPDSDGRLSVKQDGVTMLDTGPRPTMTDDRVIFFVGSASRYVSPAPFSVFIDDAAITLAEPSP